MHHRCAGQKTTLADTKRRSAKCGNSGAIPDRFIAMAAMTDPTLQPEEAAADSRRPQNDLIRLAQKHQVDKWGSHWYAQHYHHHFKHLRYQSINLLEIGVGGYANPAA